MSSLNSEYTCRTILAPSSVTARPRSAGAGDLVFYSEDGYNITHAGIATGYGTVIHSSSYFGAVVETDMYGIPGYVGSRDVY